MGLASQILKLLEAITAAEIEAMPPAERQRFAQLLAHWAKLAGDPVPPGPLADLDRNPREG
jgi:hypothetical protein